MLPTIVLLALTARPAEARDDQGADARPDTEHTSPPPRAGRGRPSPKPVPTSRPAPQPRPAPRPAPQPAPKPTPRPAPNPPTQRPAPSPSPAPPTSRPSPPSSAPNPSSRPAPSSSPGQQGRPTGVPTSPTTSAPPRADRLPGRAQTVPNASQRTSAYPANVHVVQNQRPESPAYRDWEPVRKPPTSGATRPADRPPQRSGDPRYSRPAPSHVRPPPYAHDRPPIVHTYAGWYTGWYCHPWYRWTWGTWAVVSFGFWVDPWAVWWVPPTRWGWSWYPGYWYYGVWWPGYWGPVGYAPVGYVFVPGWWENTVYVEGYYRVEDRDGWEWVDGYYLEDGTHIRGHWRPTGDWPDGYTWEPGFWDGQDYNDGFWRPEFRAGFVWISAWYDDQGIYHAGYWSPTEDNPGHQWVPGWFDGNEWVPGYWVSDEEVEREDVDAWQPPEGYDAGWKDEPDPRTIDRAPTTPPGKDAPLAIPVPTPPPE